MGRRSTWVRTTLGALVATAMLTVPAPAAQAERFCPDQSVNKSVAWADVVFRGVLERVEEGANATRYFIRVEERWKEQTTLASSVWVEGPARGAKCALPALPRGVEVVVLARAEGAVLTTDVRRNTGKARNGVVKKILAAPGIEANSGPAPEPAPAVFEKVETSAPRPVSRLAAPGAALVLIGLLGLAGVGLSNRRRG